MAEKETTNEEEVVEPAAPEGDEPQKPETEAPAEAPEVETPEEEAPEEVPEQPEAEEAPEEQPKSRREALRIAKLVERQLEKRQQQQLPTQPQGLDYATALEADPEVVKQLEADRRTVSDSAYQQGVSRAETIGWKTALRLESPGVEAEYTFLNPKDEANFNPAAANAMNQKYLRYVGYDAGDPQKGVPETVQIPDVSYREFVEAEMEFADEIASQRVASTTRNIVKQASKTGLRPDGSSAKRLNLNKDPEMMTDEELSARIKQAGLPS